MACIFCRIAAKELPSKVVFEDPEVLAIVDINPQAPVHLLVMPRLHIPDLGETTVPHMALLGKLVLVAKDLAVKYKLQPGFRLVMNNGRLAGQTVDHIHVHLLGGRQMTWPPG